MSFHPPPSVEVQGAVWTSQGQVHFCSGDAWVRDSQTQQENQRRTFLSRFFPKSKKKKNKYEVRSKKYFCFSWLWWLSLRSSTRWNTTRTRRRGTPCLMTLHTSSTWRRSKTSPALWVLLSIPAVLLQMHGESKSKIQVFMLSSLLVIHLAAEIQRGVREEQGPDQHRPWGSWYPCCQGGLQEHH